MLRGAALRFGRPSPTWSLATLPWGLVACVQGGESVVDELDANGEGVDAAEVLDVIDVGGNEACVDPVCRVATRCPAGCATFDAPCFRGVCGEFGCTKVHLTGSACDDLDECTTNDRCFLGQCVGAAVRCAEGCGSCDGGFDLLRDPNHCGSAETLCPGGAEARCVGGHCTVCRLELAGRELCQVGRFPILMCPNMPGGVRVVASAWGVIRYDHSRAGVGISWADSAWGVVGTGWCDPATREPQGCFGPRPTASLVDAFAVTIDRFALSAGTVGAYLSEAESARSVDLCTESSFDVGSYLEVRAMFEE